MGSLCGNLSSLSIPCFSSFGYICNFILSNVISMNPNLVAKVENLVITKGNRALQNPISMYWRQGEMWCITGPSGSGKTTFLKILAGLAFAPRAKIVFPMVEQLRNAADHPMMISDYIAYVPQEVKISAGFIQDMYYQRRYQSAEQDEIATTREVLLRASAGSDSGLDEVAELMNLSKLMDQPFVQLSNGQTRRLMIAVALVKNPKILLLDNPYTGLDLAARSSLNKYLKKMADGGVHVFMAAHEHELSGLDFITDTWRLDPVMRVSSDRDFPDFYKTPIFPDCGPVIVAKDIRVAYGERVVLDIPSWEVKPLERWIIRGDNGSGKSTLLALISADHPQAYSNRINIFGKKRGSGESIWDVKRRIGFFSSELLRYFSKLPTAEEVMASGWNDITGQIRKLNDQQRKYVRSLAGWLGIATLLPIRIGELSLSQQKMTLIARAMIRNPEILILDEPLQGMDAEWRDHFKAKIDEFSRSRTVLYVAHDDEEIPEGDWKILNLNRVV